MSKSSHKVVRVELNALDIAEIQQALSAVFVRRLELAGSPAKYREMYGDTLFTDLDHKMSDAMLRLMDKNEKEAAVPGLRAIFAENGL